MYDTKSKQDYHTKTQRKTSIQESKLPSSKKGSKHPTPPVSEQKWLGLGVLSKYLQAGFGCLHGKDRCHPFHSGLVGNEAYIDMFSFGVEYKVLCHTNRTGAVTK